MTFRDVFGVREFRALWGAAVLSLIGDQIAIVALTWLVFERTDSPLLSAATYAISFLPWIIGGPLLSGLADRLPRRDVMVACDVVRAVLLCAMSLPGIPLWVLCALLFLTELCSPPFSAARAALLPDVLPGDLYVVGTAIGNITSQVGQVAGFALGGLLVALIDTPVLLMLNALTFAVSAAVIARRVTQRPAAASREPKPTGRYCMTPAPGSPWFWVGAIFGSSPDWAGCACSTLSPRVWPCPTPLPSVAAPTAAGSLLAAIPCGAAFGAIAFSRLVRPARRLALMGPLAVVTCAPLVVFALRPGLVLAVVLFAASGAASAYQLAANAAFVAAVPPEARGTAFGLVQAVMCVGQGLAIVTAGALAQLWEPAWVITGAGLGGCVVAARLAAQWRRVSRGAGAEHDCGPAGAGMKTSGPLGAAHGRPPSGVGQGRCGAVRFRSTWLTCRPPRAWSRAVRKRWVSGPLGLTWRPPRASVTGGAEAVGFRSTWCCAWRTSWALA